MTAAAGGTAVAVRGSARRRTPGSVPGVRRFPRGNQKAGGTRQLSGQA
ncbi:hypothetical protein SSTG_06157 [Streptomyces sp. e14]|nr:hypothetical protein SSTG_06157 [Streptomyces sp. e14]